MVYLARFSRNRELHISPFLTVNRGTLRYRRQTYLRLSPRHFHQTNPLGAFPPLPALGRLLPGFTQISLPPPSRSIALPFFLACFMRRQDSRELSYRAGRTTAVSTVPSAHPLYPPVCTFADFIRHPRVNFRPRVRASFMTL